MMNPAVKEMVEVTLYVAVIMFILTLSCLLVWNQIRPFRLRQQVMPVGEVYYVRLIVHTDDLSSDDCDAGSQTSAVMDGSATTPEDIKQEEMTEEEDEQADTAFEHVFATPPPRRPILSPPPLLYRKRARTDAEPPSVPYLPQDCLFTQTRLEKRVNRNSHGSPLL